MQDVNPDRSQEVTNKIVYYVLLNIIAVHMFAVFHNLSKPADLTTTLNYQALFFLIGFESSVLFLPGLALFFLLRRFSSRLAVAGCATITLAVSAVYFLDIATLLTFREHLLSGVFFRLVGSVLPFIHTYIDDHHLSKIIMLTATWIAGQTSCWIVAWYFARKQQKSTRPQEKPTARQMSLACIAFIPIIFIIAPAFKNLGDRVKEFNDFGERHPITAIGFFSSNRVPQLATSSIETIQGQTLMLDRRGQLREYVDRYKELKIVDAEEIASGATELPDIMIIICECLRPEVITAKTAPNIFGKSQEGLWLKQHYSAGNASCYGFFGVMTGTDACWYEQAKNMPIGLYTCLKSIGYETGFFGMDDFNTFGMNMFCAPERFDVCEFVPDTTKTESDQRAFDLAGQFFNRTGKYPNTSDAPRMAIVYAYSPHDSAHETVDAIHQLADAEAIEPSDRRDNKRFVDYMNSIKFFDRIAKPLLRDDCITFIVGDHGESFGEDRRHSHGNACSQVQMQTAGIAFGPGIPTQIITQPTCHHDILPTIADALNLRFSDPQALPGVTLLRDIPDDRIVACRGWQQPQYLFVPPQRDLHSDELGYQGFFSVNQNVLSPGATINIWADSDVDSEEQGTWPHAGLLLDWVSRRFGSEFADIPEDPKPKLHELVKNIDTDVQLQCIQLIKKLGDESREFVPDLETCLSSKDENVRTAAFTLLHRIHATASAKP